MATPQELFAADAKTKIKQYLYRELEVSFDPFIAVLQRSSRLGNLNWHVQANKVRLERVFTNIATAVSAYSIVSGDFRSYLLEKTLDIIYEEFKNELLADYVSRTYGSEVTVGSLDAPYTLQAPQNTSFPGLQDTTNPMNPVSTPLVPSVLYSREPLV